MSIQNYAIVETASGEVINVVLWDGESDWTPPTGNNAILIPNGVTVAAGYTYASGQFTAPTVEAPIAPTLAQQAQLALTAMDSPGGCAIRCFKAGVAFPSNWQTYTAELRAIVNGSANPMPSALPTQPAFPSGT